ncbi:hypothetical protein C7M84_025279 [Penaeus vannamei]|uniref:Resistance to inhibitors of cholinesterase protein 3 N-terminal domain-containing protein n=1 Tax=Penaeus vannamei TaxID=6689 RepID=A0A3R7PC60_PENVA|nr:hypothetical protein C7M84_025279 [Penaeus vannamei]
MLTASVKHPTSSRQATWRNEANLHFADQLCYLLEEHYAAAVPPSAPSASASSSISGVRWSAEECWLVVWRACGHEMNETLVEDVRLGRDKSNLTECLTSQFGLTPALVASAAPPKVRLRPYLPQSMGGHARPERPAHLYPEMMHPALREKGRAMPQRTIDKQARPGPMPGVRPPMGGAGGMVPPPQGKGSGAMGIIMPLYTVGIVVFFVYTIMKGKFFSDDKQQKEDPGTPDEAEASPAPLLKEITTGTPKRSPDDAQGANAEAEDSSEATETGADISELKFFAEKSHGHEKALVAEEIPVPIPEEEYCPSIRMGLMDEAASEDSAVLCKGQGTQTSLALSLTPPQAVSKEHSTQTDEEQGVAVLGVQTSFLHDEGGVETRAGSHGPVKTEGVTEILLDALLPSETQLIKKSHTAPETSDQFSKDDKSALQELEAKEVQKEAGNEPLPDSPSLEAIAEAVAAATTRAALDLLATTNSDTLIKPQEVQEAASSPSISSLPKTADTKVVPSELGEEARKPSEQVTEASRSQTQSDASQPTTVYVATVTHTPSPSPTSTPEKEKTQESVEADLMKASVPQGEIPAETSKTDAASPVPISQDVVVTKTVEAALAEAAEEVCDINTNKDTKHQDTTATQDHQGVATVSPNEDSPTSSKGSSPDMEEYEVINKDEDTAHKLRTQRETSGGEPVVDKVKAAESTEVSSQAAQLHTDEEGASKKDTEPQKEEKVVKGKERSSSKEPEEKKSSDKTNVCEDQGKDSTPCPVDDSSAKATDPQATVCMPSESLVAEEGQTDIDSSTLKESVSSDNADSE